MDGVYCLRAQGWWKTTSTNNWCCPKDARGYWKAPERDMVQCQHREDVGGFSPAGAVLHQMPVPPSPAGEMPVTSRSEDREQLLSIADENQLGEMQQQLENAQEQLEALLLVMQVLARQVSDMRRTRIDSGSG